MGTKKHQYISKVIRILFSIKGIVWGAFTLGALSLIVFVSLHYANIPAGGATTWIILGILTIIAVARGLYVTKSELWRLEHYREL